MSPQTPTSIATGPLIAASATLIDRYTLTLAATEGAAFTTELEPKFAPLFSRDDLSAAHMNLQTAYDEFKARYAAAKARAANAMADKKRALSTHDSESDTAVAAASAQFDGEIAVLTSQLVALKNSKKAQIVELRATAKDKATAIRTEADAQIATFDAEGRSLAASLAAAYQSADETYRAMEGIWTANCNEKSKRALIRQIFPTVRRGGVKKVATTPVTNGDAATKSTEQAAV